MGHALFRKRNVVAGGVLIAILFIGTRLARTGEPVAEWKKQQEQAVKGFVETSDQAVTEWEAQRQQLIKRWKSEKAQAVRDFQQEREKILKLWEDENEAIVKVWKEKQDSTVLQWRKYGVNFRSETDFEGGAIKASGAVLVDKNENIEDAKKKAYRIAMLKLNDQVLDIKPTNKESLRELSKKKEPGLSEQVDQFIAENTVPQEKEEKVEPVAGTDKNIVRVEVKTSMVREGMKKLIDPVVKAEVRGAKKFSVADTMAGTLLQQIKKEGPFTGLLIDAREVVLTPCLAPEIVTEDGKRVYGMGIAEDRYVAQTGVVGWTKTIKPARVNIRIGEKPMTIGARKVRKGNQIVISSDDANRVSVADSEFTFMPKGRVVIAVD